MSTVIAGAYHRTTGELIGTRPAKDADGRSVFSSSYMEEQFILLIGHELPSQVTVGTMQKTITPEEGQPYKVTVPTVNGSEYVAYMWIGVRNG